MSHATLERKALADMLDFGCFVTIVLLYAAVLLLLATLARGRWEGVVNMLVAIVPLGLWLAALVPLRRHLEVDRKGMWRHWERRRIATEHHIDEHHIADQHLEAPVLGARLSNG